MPVEPVTHVHENGSKAYVLFGFGSYQYLSLCKYKLHSGSLHGEKAKVKSQRLFPVVLVSFQKKKLVLVEIK